MAATQVDSTEEPGGGIAETVERLRELFECPRYRPPVLPRVASEILELSTDDRISIARIVDVLEQDPVLAGHVLRMVRSAFYAGAAPALSLRQAIVRMGLITLRQVVVEVALSVRVFQARPYQDTMQRLALHSRSTAHIACDIGRRTALDPALAFMTGLLHDVGFAGLIILLAEDRRNRDLVQLDDVWPALELLNGAACLKMAEAWRLAPLLRDALRAYHRGDMGAPAAAAVLLAEDVAGGLGFPAPRGPATPSPSTTEQLAAARTHLGLDEQVLEDIAWEASRRLPTLR